jgi:hypothetical protein
MIRSIFFVLFFFLFFIINAQILDSLKAALQNKPGIDLGFGSRNSFLLNDNVKFQGIHIGARFGKKLKLGISFNWLNTTTFNRVAYFYSSFNDTTSGYFKMAYIALYTKIIYHKTKRWEFSTPLQIGYGSSWIQYQKQISLKHQEFKKNMIVYEPTVAIQFKLIKWIALSGNFGYRFVWHKDERVLSNLNGPIYVLNLDVLLDQLFFEIFPDSPITHIYGPA